MTGQALPRAVTPSPSLARRTIADMRPFASCWPDDPGILDTRTAETMRRALVLCACLPALACQGTYELRAYGEAFVEAGIPASEVSDGWSIRFTEFVVSVGEVSIDGRERRELPGWYVFDLAQPSDGRGHLLDGIEASFGDYDNLRYRLAEPGEIVGGNATSSQIAHLVDNDAALHVVGTATKGDRTIAFDWTFKISFGHLCRISGRVNRNEHGGTQLTIHADHLLLDDLGPNGVIAFDLIAAADVDEDGLVVPAELAQVNILTEERYQTEGRDIRDLWTFIGNLSLTLGHVDGEGGCDPSYTPEAYQKLSRATADTAQGPALYAAHCAECHGEHGAGDGPLAAEMRPRPTNLAMLDHAAISDAYLFFRIAEGGGFFPYTSTMPGFRQQLTDAEIWALVDYVYVLEHGQH